MTMGSRRPNLGLALLAAGLILAAGSCGGGGEARKPDASANPDTPVVVVDSGGSEDRPGETGTPAKPNGDPCTTNGECASEFCVDGLCCNSACEEACYTCSRSDLRGTCVPSDIDTNPGNRCATQDISTCGTTGRCDGSGACLRYAVGSACQSATCVGSTLTASGTCNAAGVCEAPTPGTCMPYVCGANGQCRTTCTVDGDCMAPNTCIAGSCGKKPLGGSCGNGMECNSGFCSQGVCCSSDCTGTCRSCALSTALGSCTPVPAGQDPLEQCAMQAASTCGLDGACDGTGSCRRYPANTVCGTDVCTTGTSTPAGRCNAAGTCVPGTAVPCTPFTCGTTACRTTCAGDADCAAGFVCVGTSCQRKPNGRTCAGGSECASGNCVQGVCCNTACQGTCMTCTLATAVGTCSPIAAGQPPLQATQCPMATTMSCGNDGTCNGAGACRQHAAGTQCVASSCTGFTLSSAQTCDGMGLCRPATTSTCAPFVCAASGTPACRITCSTNADCSTGNSCVNGSCGLLPIGATCTAGTACASGNCVQGVCCNTTCTGTCMSCTVANSVGTCSPVAGGGAPVVATQCVATAASTCGLDGTCNGIGGCRRHVSGTQCAAPTCGGTTPTETSPRVCDGLGVCGAATTEPCSPFQCDATECRTTCTTDAHCIAPNTCINGSCGKKANGATCAAPAECASNFCAQGRCCNEACNTACKSCALATPGTCSNIANGMPPLAAAPCAAAAMDTCGLDGMCNGAGACRQWADGTVCAAGTCTAGTLTPARTCNGAGVCRTVTNTSCTPYACASATSCGMMPCTTNAECLAPNTCINGSCGKKPNGAACTTLAECNSNFCAQGVCCSTACSGICVSCNLATPGVCASVPAGQDPLGNCTMDAATTCDQDGFCNGSGACRLYSAGTSCGSATCSMPSQATAAPTCNGTGTCVTPTPVNCPPYMCNAGACRTTCTTSADCSMPNICAGGACVPSTNLRVDLRMFDLGNVQFITPNFRLYNLGTSAVPMTELTVRYWYTVDSAAPVPAQSANCNYSHLPNSCAALAYNAPFVAVSPARTGADYYFQFGFTTMAGNLPTGVANGGKDIQFQWNKNNWSNFTQTGDYSFNNQTASWVTTTAVTVYRNGFLVYGTEP